MNPYRSLVQALGTTRAFTWFASRALPPLDARFAGRRRSVTSLGTGFPLCYLTTTGRRSGQPRTVPLLHVADGDRVVLFASNWGKPAPPAWALNLDAAPTVELAVAGRSRSMRARRATWEEAERYWPQARRIYPGYEGYRRRARREIAVFVLEPT
ncbi:MAG: nitroreductase/quinone reductase family protein [Gaiella sp.]